MKERRMISKGDVLLLVAAFLIAGVLFFVLKNFSSPGKSARIMLDGKTLATLPLSEDAEYMVEQELGTNRVVVKDGEVTVDMADCPDKICERHAPIRNEGETIICLPHKLVVEITGT